MDELKNLDSIDWEIINLKSRGLKDREIAEVIHFSPKTVKRRLSKLYERLEVHNSIQMLRKLNELGVDVWNIGRGSR